MQRENGDFGVCMPLDSMSSSRFWDAGFISEQFEFLGEYGFGGWCCDWVGDCGCVSELFFDGEGEK